MVKIAFKNFYCEGNSTCKNGNYFVVKITLFYCNFDGLQQKMVIFTLKNGNFSIKIIAFFTSLFAQIIQVFKDHFYHSIMGNLYNILGTHIALF